MSFDDNDDDDAYENADDIYKHLSSTASHPQLCVPSPLAHPFTVFILSPSLSFTCSPSSKLQKQVWKAMTLKD